VQEQGSAKGIQPAIRNRKVKGHKMRYIMSVVFLSKEISALVLLVCMSRGLAWADTFELINGDTITGKVIKRTPDEITVDHPILGHLLIPVRTLKHAETNPGLFGTSLLRGWDKELNLSLEGTRGNDVDNSILVGLDLSYIDNTRRWKIRGQYKVSNSQGKIDNNYGYLESNRDWLFAGSRWFTFTLGRYDFDQFESWKHRLYVGAGPGYHFLQEGAFTLDGRFGLGVGYNFKSEQEFAPIALVGLEGKWQFTKTHSLTFSNQILPHLDELGTLNRSTVEWKRCGSTRPKA
jgi:hypothetical protein